MNKLSVKINSLQIENTKRVKAVKLEPSPNGLTIIGGNNKQGKTSVLDSIAWALGGNRLKPSEPNRQNSVNNPYLKVTLSNGLIVERKGKNSDLSVTDPAGEKHGQNLLNSFIEELALDLPKFMNATPKEKADTLLDIIGIGDELQKLEVEEEKLYNERTYVGQTQKQKEKYAAELPSYQGLPTDYISASELVQKQQTILAQNGENNRKREQVEQLNYQSERESELIASKKAEIVKLQQELEQVEVQHQGTLNDLETASKTAEQLQDESTSEIESSIANIEETNDKIRTNLSKESAEEEAKNYKFKYDGLTDDINHIRQQKTDLLEKANLPLPDLAVVNGELTYEGQQWDNMSGSDRLKVSASIVKELKPECGFVLIDGLEAMDLNSLAEFGKWLEQENLQAIAARVTSGEEATIIIEEGEVVGAQEQQLPPTQSSPTQEATTQQGTTQEWKGEF